MERTQGISSATLMTSAPVMIITFMKFMLVMRVSIKSNCFIRDFTLNLVKTPQYISMQKHK